MDVYLSAKHFDLACYQRSNLLPQDEKFGRISQIRRAALSVHKSIAEGCSRKSEAERKRYDEVDKGSLIEMDAALAIAKELHFQNKQSIQPVGERMVTCFKLLTGLIASKTHH